MESYSCFKCLYRFFFVGFSFLKVTGVPFFWWGHVMPLAVPAACPGITGGVDCQWVAAVGVTCSN